MENKIAIIGYVDHGKTTLTAAIMSALKSETKTINQIIEEEKMIPITAREIKLTQFDVKNGKESRRERRAKKRKSKKR